jgi:hypothetical protein
MQPMRNGRACMQLGSPCRCMPLTPSNHPCRLLLGIQSIHRSCHCCLLLSTCKDPAHQLVRALGRAALATEGESTGGLGVGYHPSCMLYDPFAAAWSLIQPCIHQPGVNQLAGGGVRPAARSARRPPAAALALMLLLLLLLNHPLLLFLILALILWCFLSWCCCCWCCCCC